MTKNREILKSVSLPVFLPDGTRGVVRSVDSRDLKDAKVEGVVVNTFHLLSEPGIEVIQKAGGIKKFMDFAGLVISDSGGFQVLSLIYKDKSLGKITEEGAKFYLSSTGKKKKYLLTPELSIQTQFDLGADILICLDDCPLREAAKEQLKISVDRTIRWAKRCKEEYLKQLKKRKLIGKTKPLLFGVIQGGSDQKLRRYCARELIKIGFDGYGFGGWPILEDGKVDLNTLEFAARLMPDDLPKYALGVGDPKTIVACVKMGYQIFDCVLPTRDARHHRLYIFTKDPDKTDVFKEVPIGYVYINKSKYIGEAGPVSRYCGCHTCLNYSAAYLHHLFKVGDSLAWRLATIHNLWTFNKIISLIREKTAG